MPIKTLIAGGVSILGVLAMSGTANANCFPSQGQNCNPGTVVVNPYKPKFDAVTVHNREPLGHLRSVNFQRSPNVSITRVHGLAPNVALNDAPSGFTDGCNPSSTVYCRAGNGAAAAPIASAPIAAPIVSAPVYSAPVIQHQQPLRTWIGGGYDPSKFIPRQYGENTFTPGIAHIPTSIVDRSPERADYVLNSGRTIPQSTVLGGVAPRTETYHIAQNAGPNAQFIQGPLIAGPILSGPVLGGGLPALPTPAPSIAPQNFVQPSFAQPSFAQPSFVQPSFVQPSFAQPSFAPVNTGQATAPLYAGNGTYASNVGADGTYWEKTSGLTSFGDTIATQVICKRKLPTQTVNPVIGVPTPICVVPGHGPHAAHGVGVQQGFSGAVPSGQWTY